MPPEPERDLAAFAAELETEAIPDRVRDRAGLTIADTLGAIVGVDRRRGRRARAALDRRVSGGRRCSAPTAARRSRRWRRSATARRAPSSNSTRGIGSPPATRRSTCCPRCWADAEIGYGDSDAFVRSFVAGYEVAVRTEPPARSGRSNRGTTRTRRGGRSAARPQWHARGLDPETTRSAMAIAANYAQHTRFEAATEGATVRNVYAGMSNLAALVAVDQAEAGFGGGERRRAAPRIRRRRGRRGSPRRDSASAGSWNTATSRSTPRVGTPTRRWMPSRPSRTGWMRPRWSRSASRRIRRPHG